MHYADSFWHDFTVLFCFLVSTAMGSSTKLDSLNILSGAAFHIVGLTDIPKIEFLPLDWIYCSIRIMTVYIKCVRRHEDKIKHDLQNRHKTWSLDSGLDSGLDYGLDYGLDFQLIFQNFSGLPHCSEFFLLLSKYNHKPYPLQKSRLARLEAEVMYSEHICSSKTLLLLSHWTCRRGAEASLVTARQKPSSDFSYSCLKFATPC